MKDVPEFATHENLSRHETVRGSSDRSFGLVMAAFFAILGLVPLVRGGAARPWYIAVAVAFAAVAFLKASLLHPLNVLWTRLGMLLARIVNPIVMGILFYGVITPAALLLRLLGKDPLKLRYDSKAASYWEFRNPPGPAPETMSNQF